ncbi:MAG: hypothetical protein QOI24_896 [Acidobacteriota bacterium]|jgi:hypothetical protein|nr:hypothetical protein [Acidobacteriota bacterium]
MLRSFSRVALTLVLFAAVPSHAQSPAADWLTIATPHFRIHYPRPYEEWARTAASRIESVRDAVSKEVGYTPPQITDIIVMNPYAEANGLTYPLLDSPRIVLYAEEPAPEEQIGEYRDWIDLLTVHEVAHLVHLLRPPRNPSEQLLSRVVPLNPITLRAPRWVLEGYATVVEGRITGSGRPSSSIRAAVLRKWAGSGRLPTYAQLSSDRQFLGMSMAYLAGSAYLEWLEARSGPDSFRHLWARMTARRRRSFDEAFEGVFGDSPRRLYAKFTAELTSRAIGVEHDEDPSLREGELWQETRRNSREPAVSPDGKQLAMVLRDEQGRAKLVIFSTEAPAEEEAKQQKAIDELLRRDPEDVGPVRSRPLPRKPVETLVPSDGGDIESPRWMPNGRSLIYSHRQPDRDGFLHHDLFRWTPQSGEIERLTTLDDVRDADPFPDERRAIAVRSRFGYSQLVIVNLLTGAIEPYTKPTLDRVYSHPRVARDGRVAWAEHGEVGWRVMLDGKPLGPDGSFAPEFGAKGELLALVAAKGFIDVHRIDGGDEAVTRVAGAAFDPAPSPDGSLFFMSLEPDGFVVRRLASTDGAPLPPPPSNRAFVPALPPEANAHAELPTRTLRDAVPYGFGRQELSALIGGTSSAGYQATEIGLRVGDVVGRLDTLLIASFGETRGAAIISAWRGWPVTVIGHGFHDRKSDGLELRGSWTKHAPQTTLVVEGGALAGDSSRVFVDTRVGMRQVFGTLRTDALLRAAADSRQHYRVSARGVASIGGVRAGATFIAAKNDMTVGGMASSIIPESLNVDRVFDPALAPGSLSGRRYTGARFDLTFPAIAPFTAFYQYHRIGPRARVAGLEATLRGAPVPILKFAAFDVTAGVARVIDDRKTKLWLSLRWRP